MHDGKGPGASAPEVRVAGLQVDAATHEGLACGHAWGINSHTCLRQCRGVWVAVFPPFRAGPAQSATHVLKLGPCLSIDVLREHFSCESLTSQLCQDTGGLFTFITHVLPVEPRFQFMPGANCHPSPWWLPVDTARRVIRYTVSHRHWCRLPFVPPSLYIFCQMQGGPQLTGERDRDETDAAVHIAEKEAETQRTLLRLENDLMESRARSVSALALGNFGVTMAVVPRSGRFSLRSRKQRHLALLDPNLICTEMSHNPGGPYPPARRGVSTSSVTPSPATYGDLPIVCASAKLGRGGQGEVYQGVYYVGGMGIDVAVKIAGGRDKDPKALLREMRALTKLVWCEHVVKSYGWCRVMMSLEDCRIVGPALVLEVLCPSNHFIVLFVNVPT